jgi:ferredoxin
MLRTGLAVLALSACVCDAFQAPVRDLSASARPARISFRGARSLCASSAAVATGGNDDDVSDEPVREWPKKELRNKGYSLGKGEVAVRFINAPGHHPSDGQNDIIAAAKPGDVLIQVGDSVGISLPRGCMTGLCGSCTCDLEDPSFPGSRSVLRACSTRVSMPHHLLPTHARLCMCPIVARSCAILSPGDSPARLCNTHTHTQPHTSILQESFFFCEDTQVTLAHATSGGCSRRMR